MEFTMRDILWKLGAKQLKENEWKRMAVQWNFSGECHGQADYLKKSLVNSN
jgi:hypothetical protein